MNDDFVRLFQREYAALMELAGDLPPDVARRLRLSRDRVSDPHVERLLEGVAYLGARVHARLDDEFPELTDGLLNILYPQMLAPFPSSMLVRLVPKADLQKITPVEQHTSLRSAKIGDVACRFRTSAAAILWPLEIESVRLTGRPLPLPDNPMAPNAAGVLRMTLRCLDRNTGFASLAKGEPDGLPPLRLHLTGGPTAFALYKLICNHAVSVAFASVTADGIQDTHPDIKGPGAISPGGFGPEDALIPWPENGFSGFRLISEYFALPEKFLCFDICGLDIKARATPEGRLDILIYLDEVPAELERVVDAAHIAHGCVPAVNLFSRRCEPIDLDWSQTEYRVDPDRGLPASMEVWSIEEVRENLVDGTSRILRKLFHRGMVLHDSDPASYIPLVRPAAGQIGGTETFLAFDMPGFDPATQSRSRVSIQALCTNRDLPALLPFGREGTPLLAETGIYGVDRVVSVTAPTSTYRPASRGHRSWQFISHLSMSHLALVGGDAGAETLREILSLYDLRQTAETRAAVAALVSVSSQDGVARLPGIRPGVFCRGTDITLNFTPQAWRGGSLFLLASIIERFLRLHATVNSFVRTRVTLQGHPDPVATFRARSGTRDLL